MQNGGQSLFCRRKVHVDLAPGWLFGVNFTVLPQRSNKIQAICWYLWIHKWWVRWIPKNWTQTRNSWKLLSGVIHMLALHMWYWCLSICNTVLLDLMNSCNVLVKREWFGNCYDRDYKFFLYHLNHLSFGSFASMSLK